MAVEVREVGHVVRTSDTRFAESIQFLRKVYSLPGGEHIRACIQCGTCSGSCPNANVMSATPRQVIAMVQAGMEQELLASNSMWYCISCYLCTVRCPRNVPVTDIMYMLKGMALRKRGRLGDKATATLASSFVSTVSKSGRNNEMALLLRYYMRTNPLASLKMAPLGLKLFTRGRMGLRGKGVKHAQEFQAVMAKARELGEGQ